MSKEKTYNWRVYATNFEGETELVLEDFLGTHEEAENKIDSIIDEIEKEIGFIRELEYEAQ
jgi:hypothetical protein